MVCCEQKRSDANKKPKPVAMQTKKIGCKQKTCHNANKKDQMQTKKIGCKQKRLDVNKKPKTCHDAMQTKRSDASKKDRMQTKKIGCKQKPKPVTMQTKKIGCKQKTKTCHDASSSLGQLTLSLATSYKLQIMILKL